MTLFLFHETTAAAAVLNPLLLSSGDDPNFPTLTTSDSQNHIFAQELLYFRTLQLVRFIRAIYYHR